MLRIFTIKEVPTPDTKSSNVALSADFTAVGTQICPFNNVSPPEFYNSDDLNHNTLTYKYVADASYSVNITLFYIYKKLGGTGIGQVRIRKYTALTAITTTLNFFVHTPSGATNTRTLLATTSVAAGDEIYVEADNGIYFFQTRFAESTYFNVQQVITTTFQKKELDLYEDEVLALNFQASDLTKPDSIQSNYSATYKLPLTANNRDILSDIDLVENINNTAYSIIDCIVEQDGVQIIKNGQLSINEYSNNQASVNIFSGNRDFFATLGDLSIQDLNFDSYNHTVYIDTAFNSRNNTYSNVYIYALQKSGFFEDLISRYYNQFLPSVFARAIFEKIVTEAGFTISATYPSQFSNLLVPFTNKEIVPWSDEEDTLIADKSVRAGLTGNFIQSASPQNIPFNDVTSDGNFNSNDGNFNTSTYRYNVDDSYVLKITVSIRFEFETPANFDPGVFAIIKYDSTTATTSVVKAYLVLGLIIDFPRTYSFEYESGICVAGDYFFLQFSTNATTTGLTIYDNPDTYFKVEPIRKAYTGSGSEIWRISENLPDIKQKDFYKSMLQLYGLQMTLDKNNPNNIILYSLNDVEANIPSALDWSNKYYFNNKERITFRIAQFAQNNYIVWKDASLDDRGNIVSNNLNLDDEKEIIKFPFDYTERWYAQELSNNIADVKINEYTVNEDSEGNTSISNNIIGTNPRLILKGNTASYTVLAEDISGTPTQYTNTHRIADIISLQSNTITYYDTLVDILNNSKLIRCDLLLDAVDILNLDFSTPIYLDVFKAYFYVNKINQWSDGKTPCQIELIRL